MPDIYKQRDNSASNSYTLHKYRDPKGHQAKFDGLMKSGVEISPIDYGQMTTEILRHMFVGNLTFTRSKSGMTTTCYLHMFGTPIVKGICRGGGFDMYTEAFRNAVVKTFPPVVNPRFPEGKTWQDLLRDEGIFAAMVGG